MRNSIKEGDFVQSRFRAPWKGTVFTVVDSIAYIQQEIDRHGHPIRKPKIATLHTGWLRKVERNTEND